LGKIRGGFEITHLRSSNINHYVVVIHTAHLLPKVKQILHAFTCPGRTEPLHVDVVACEGNVWVKDRASLEKKTSSVRRRTTFLVQDSIPSTLLNQRYCSRSMELCNTDSDESDSSSTEEVSFKRRFTEDPQSKYISKDYEAISTCANVELRCKSVKSGFEKDYNVNYFMEKIEPKRLSHESIDENIAQNTDRSANWCTELDKTIDSLKANNAQSTPCTEMKQSENVKSDVLFHHNTSFDMVTHENHFQSNSDLQNELPEKSDFIIAKWTFGGVSMLNFIDDDLLINPLVDFSPMVSVLQQSKINTVDRIARVNLDLTALITLVSVVAHGGCYFRFKEKILCE
ncbi:hypothetical protein MAR_006398, partial [Mya arenaria]